MAEGSGIRADSSGIAGSRARVVVLEEDGGSCRRPPCTSLASPDSPTSSSPSTSTISSFEESVKSSSGDGVRGGDEAGVYDSKDVGMLPDQKKKPWSAYYFSNPSKRAGQTLKIVGQGLKFLAVLLEEGSAVLVVLEDKFFELEGVGLALGCGLRVDDSSREDENPQEEGGALTEGGHPQRGPAPRVRDVAVHPRIPKQLEGDHVFLVLAAGQEGGESKVGLLIHVQGRHLEQPPKGLLLIVDTSVMKNGATKMELLVHVHTGLAEEKVKHRHAARIAGARQWRGVVGTVFDEAGTLKGQELLDHLNVPELAGDHEGRKVLAADGSVDEGGEHDEELTQKGDVPPLADDVASRLSVFVGQVGHENFLPHDPLEQGQVAVKTGQVKQRVSSGILHIVDELLSPLQESHDHLSGSISRRLEDHFPVLSRDFKVLE